MTQAYVEQFEHFARNGGTRGPGWLAPLRRAAFERFARVGLPTTKDEEWRFTPLSPLARTVWQPARPPAGLPAAEDLAPFVFGHPEWCTLVFVNGHFAPELSTPPGPTSPVRVLSLGEALLLEPALLERELTRHAPADATAFTALNAAFMREGGVVRISPNVELATPIHLLFATTAEAAGVAMHPRNLLVVEDGARVHLVESYVTLAPGASYFANPVTEVVVGRNAWVEHSRIQRESEAAYHVGFTQVDQGSDSHYRSFSLAMGAAFARHNLHARLNASNVETLLYGLYLTRGEQLVDNHTAIFHDHPHCRSWEVYKGVLEGRSHAVFNGKVLVKPEAQKTDAKQTNRNLILSEGATVDTKPQLEIFADDVKCTHGATVGRLDELAHFYLQSRGIPREDAHRLLTYAFAAEVLGEVASDPVRAALDRVVLARLRGDR